MATLNLDAGGNPQGQSKMKSSIEDDFMYGSNVASSHVYIRLGK